MYHYSLHILLTDLYYTLNSVSAPFCSTTACPGKQHSPALADLTDEVSNSLL